MADTDSDFMEEEEKEQAFNEAQTPEKKSKIHAHCNEQTDMQTGKKKLHFRFMFHGKFTGQFFGS